MKEEQIKKEDVTVIIPVYNEVKFIEEAVMSIVHQAKEIRICDNHSTDGTVAILKKLEKKHQNITLILQDKNYGILNSTKELLKNIKTKYTMHMGAHDLVSDNYVKVLVNCLKINKDVVFSYTPIDKIDENGVVFASDGMDEFVVGMGSENTFERVHTAIEKLRDCGLFYGITYSQLYCECFDYAIESHIDHIFITKMALKGQYKKCSEATFYRRYLNRENLETEYMKRLEGDSSQRDYQVDLSYMIKTQLKVIDGIQTSNMKEKEYYCKLARESLKSRFAGNGGRVDYRPVVDSCILKL